MEKWILLPVEESGCLLGKKQHNAQRDYLCNGTSFLVSFLGLIFSLLFTFLISF